MAETLSAELTAAAGTTLVDANVTNAKLRRFKATITLAAQASSDTVKLFKLPKGYAPLYGVLNTSVSLDTATIAIGTAASGASGKYRAAAVFTAADTPTLFGKNAANAILAADEEVILTVGTAALPASGTLIVDMICSAI